MKRILFVIPSFRMGGTLISLRNYLALIDTQRIQADVMSMSLEQGYGDLLPNCRLLTPNVWLMYVRDGMPTLKRYFHKFIGGIQKCCLSAFHIDVTSLYIRIGAYLIGSKGYDCVVCFSESIARFVCYYPAPKRIAWVHCEFSRIFKDKDENVYKRFDTIVCVSNYGKSVFDHCIPSLRNKSIVMYNVIDIDYVWKKANEMNKLDKRFDNSKYTIITIGRIDPIKQLTLIPQIAANVKQRVKSPFVWYIIGDGEEDEKQAIINEIEKNAVENNIVLLGEKENVYPYIKKSNLYVNTSKSEAYSLVNSEAKALGIPVLTNDFPCAAETITDGVDGHVTNIDCFPSIIANYINCHFYVDRKKIDNTASLIKFYNLF